MTITRELKKRLRLLLDKLDQPHMDDLAVKLVSIRAISQSWVGMPSVEVFHQISMNENLTEETLSKLDEILKRYE